MKLLRFWTFLAVDNFDFTRKIVKKMLGGDLHFLVVDNFDFPRFLSKLNFWTKI